MFVRYLAWLQATPKPPPGTKRAEKFDPSKAKSRIDQLKRDGVKNPPMPPNPMPHIIERLTEMGLSEAAGMGAAPLSWTTIDAWQRSTGISLDPWEARLIRRLSSDYLAMSREAESEACPSPWRAPVTDQQRDSELAKLRMVLG